MSYLITGAAGFIGFHVARRLLSQGERVVGIDNVNNYYSTALKRERIAELTKHPQFEFRETDIADFAGLSAALKDVKFRKVVHLAAQAGVRFGTENPHAYVQSNLAGHLNLLELCRHHDGFEAMAYASSSSVYGGNTKMPFCETDAVDTPISLYAATKRADELMSHVYAHMFGLKLIGLRFFTVYGPWGRPDMAMWLFTDAILNRRPINVFNHGNMKRDFTYIDDIVNGVVRIAAEPERAFKTGVPHRIYNIGNNRPEDLLHMISVLEETLGLEAQKNMLPLQPGDVAESFADIDAICLDYGFEPTMSIAKGIPAFVEWYKSYSARG